MLRPLLLALLASVLLAGCGSDDEGAESGATGRATTAAATTAEQEEPLKVGLITDLGQLDDDGF
ncbi:MAG: BMP family ABC transporter substrate-binding protein, partial [Actinobacteria bacterium]|nr:BMP family ABC transporter substrate-binding protein [Actinomycetota bacterium]